MFVNNALCKSVLLVTLQVVISVGDGMQRGHGTSLPPTKMETLGTNYFGQLLRKIWAFLRQNWRKILEFLSIYRVSMIKFGYFDNFSGKNHVKFGHFVNSSYIFFGQQCLASLKLTELLRLC